MAKQSNAARSMCLWVRALDVYGRMVKVVEPKRQALHQAETALAEVEAQLAAKREQLRSQNAHFSIANAYLCSVLVGPCQVAPQLADCNRTQQ